MAMWLALIEDAPFDAHAVATVTLGDHPMALLAAWTARHSPCGGAVKIDPRCIDPDGEPARAVLTIAPEERWLPFDDITVVHAVRSALAAPTPDVLSTFVLGDARFVGGISANHGEGAPFPVSPFERLFPSHHVTIGPGLLGRTPPPTGPVTQRYGPANPWPWDTFAAG